MPGRRRSLVWLCVVATTAAAAALRLHWLSVWPILPDEAVTLHYTTSYSAGELAARLPIVQPHPPFYYLLLAPVVDTFGADGGRYLSVAAGTLTIPVLYAVGVELRDERTGIAAAALAAVSPYHIELSQIIRMYAVYGLLVAVSWLALLHAQRTTSRRWLIAYAASAVLAVYTHYWGLLLVASQLVYLAVSVTPARRTRWLNTAAGIGIVTLPVPYWIVRRIVQDTPSGETGAWAAATITPPGVTDVLSVTAAGFYGSVPMPAAVKGLVALAFLGLGWVVSRRATRDTAVVLAAWVFVPVLLAVLGSHTVRPMFRPRYVVGCALGAYLVVGLYASERRPAVYLAVLLVAVTAIAAPVHYPMIDDRDTGWNDATEYVDKQGAEAVVVTGAMNAVRDWHSSEWSADVMADARTLRHAELSCRPESVVVVQKTVSPFPIEEAITVSDLGLSSRDYYVADQTSLRLLRVATIHANNSYSRRPNPGCHA